VTPTVFLNTVKPLLLDFKSHDTMQTVTVTKAKAAYQNTHSNKLLDDNIVLHDKAHLQGAQRVQDLVKTYSLNLSLCDFHILRPYKLVLKVCMFTSDGDTQKAVVQYFRQQPKEFSADRTH
jgi:hypothetical protein